MKILNSKKAIEPVTSAAIISLIPFILIVLLFVTGGIGWLMIDKGPLIIGGLFVLLILFRQKKKQGGYEK